MQLKYAKGFAVDYYETFKVISVYTVDSSHTLQEQYVILPPNKKAPIGFENAVLIPDSNMNAVCISTTHIAAMAELGLMNKISGVTNSKLIYNKQVRDLVSQGKIEDVGNDAGLNFEKIVQLNPSIIMTYGGIEGGGMGISKLKSLGQRVILNNDYMEQNPLARAEWIKFTAAFFDAEDIADSIFNKVDSSYTELREMHELFESKPTVFCNLPFKEIWYMPCGDNYMAQLLRDAGADFLWAEAGQQNGLNLSLNYEAVYGQAAEADYWINTNFANSLNEIKALDNKNTFFKAYKQKKVYNNNNRNTADGGFDFWESGAMHPELILADLINIFHPGKLLNAQLHYYHKLN
jgi:iron complex transport system substrate-binding protein